MIPSQEPKELQGLTQSEEMLIAHAFPVISVYTKLGGQKAYKGHCINFSQDIKEPAIAYLFFSVQILCEKCQIVSQTLTRVGVMNIRGLEGVGKGSKKSKVMQGLPKLEPANKRYNFSMPQWKETGE